MPLPITTVPKVPELSLGVAMQVSRGRKNVRQQIGSYQTLLLEGSINELLWQMQPNESREVGKTHGLAIFTDKPLTVTLYKPNEVIITLVVNKLLFLDDVFESVEITSGLEITNVQMTQRGIA